MSMYRDTVVVVHAEDSTHYGGTRSPDWANATRTAYPANVQPATASEDIMRRTTTATTWRAHLGPEAVVEADDRIEWDGYTLEIHGEPEAWRRRGVLHHYELLLSRIADTSEPPADTTTVAHALRTAWNIAEAS